MELLVVNMELEVVLLIVQLFLNQEQIIFDMVLDKQIVKLVFEHLILLVGMQGLKFLPLLIVVFLFELMLVVMQQVFVVD
jgi:hypothetical protein